MQELSNDQTQTEQTPTESKQSTQSTNAEENQDKQTSGELMERQQIEGTPFWIMGNKTDGYYMVMGHYRITNVMNTMEEVTEYLNTNKWDVILSMIISVNHTDKELMKDAVEKL